MKISMDGNPEMFCFDVTNVVLDVLSNLFLYKQSRL